MTQPSILIIDDDPDFREVMIRHLSRAGYLVSGVASAREADDVLANTLPAVVIVDGFLSDRDGESWIAAQRRAGRKLEIIFVSGFATYARDHETRQRLMRDLGVAEVLAKPVEPRELQKHVDALIAASVPATVPAPPPYDKLAGLRRTYGSELAQKVAVIATAIALARATQSRSPLDQARRLAHSLEGTAGTFGFTAVGEAAGRVSALLAGPTPEWDAIDASLADLRARVDAAQARL